jgi:formylglycine-generating enzyme required for sulfatase activity
VWVYGARGGSTSARYGDLDKIAWYYGNSHFTTHPVGQKQPNAFGLHDMLGNVIEWTNTGRSVAAAGSTIPNS